MKKNSSLKRLIISGFSLLFTVAVVLTAIFLPGDLVMKEAKDELEQVVAVPVEYQAAPSEALVRNISRQLTEEQLEAAGVPAGLVRMSCGLEDKADLIADIEQALEKI